jgi:predicted nucleotidyltransferase
MTFPDEYRQDIETAVSLLKSEGCTEIYLFGSLAQGKTPHARTDLDIAVRGLPRRRYFEIYGRLLLVLTHPVDLVDLDAETPFTHMLKKQGSLHRVA